MILLTDKEIERVIGEELRHIYSGHVAEYKDIAQAQLKAVVEQLQLRRLRWEGEPPNCFIMSEKDWQALRQEVGLEG